MLKDFLLWWAARLRELIPATLRRGDGPARDALVGEVTPGQPMRLLVRQRGRETPLGMVEDTTLWRARLAGQPRTTVLRLAPSGTAVGPLIREITLPLAAERDLDQVLRYEMDRVTPFAAADVFWTATVAFRDRARDRLGVRLVLVPCAVLRPALNALAEMGRQAGVLEVPDGRLPAGILRMALAEPGTPGVVRRGAVAGLAVLCAILAIAVVALPFVRQSLALDRIERRIATQRPAVAEAEALRRQIATARASGDVVAAQRSRVGDALAVLAAITQILPDDTYLSELTLAQRKLGLRGQSGGSGAGGSGAGGNRAGGGAARLIGLLAADPAVRDPAFSAPVVRNEAGHADLFSLRAEIVP